jgi:alkaline phosphatase D
LQDYPIEFQELQDFLKTEGIQGVVFLTGDRHHSEVIRFERPGQYPLYDITSSPLTAGVAKAGGKEKDNPYRIAGTLVETQNFTRVSVSGSTGDRQLLVEFVDGKGQVLGQWKLNENELKNKK